MSYAYYLEKGTQYQQDQKLIKEPLLCILIARGSKSNSTNFQRIIQEINHITCLFQIDGTMDELLSHVQ